MLILSLGSEYFNKAFCDQGHKVLVPSPQQGLSVKRLIHQLTDRPDLIVHTDNLGERVWPWELTGLGIPTVYYAVDGPINYWWQRHYARLFDLCLADQKQTALDLSRDTGRKVAWLPVGVEASGYRNGQPPAQAVYDFALVGVVDAQIRPKRSRLINLLAGRYHLKTAGQRGEGWVPPEEAAKLYRSAKLVLNENLFNGVTTRMLEAMAAGAALFTEKAGGDLGELFQAGEDFAWFEPHEVLEAAEYWLYHEEHRKKAARRARDKVASLHDLANRAERLLKLADGLDCGQGLSGPEADREEGAAFFLTAFRWPRQQGRARIEQAEALLNRALEARAHHPDTLFMLGQVARLKQNPEKASLLLSQGLEEGSFRAGLALAFMDMARGREADARRRLGGLTGLGDDFPRPGATRGSSGLNAEAALILAGYVAEKGELFSPGFSRVELDPAMWTALEFYQAALKADPDNTPALKGVGRMLVEGGAPAEAARFLARAMETAPGDEECFHLYRRAARASYLPEYSTC